MSAVAAKPAAGGAINPTAMAVGVVMFLILMGICYVVYPVGILMILVFTVVDRYIEVWARKNYGPYSEAKEASS